MAQKDHRTQITVALIGLVGVIATAFLANWDKIFRPTPEKAKPPTVSSQQSAASDDPASPSALPVDQQDRLPTGHEVLIDGFTDFDRSGIAFADGKVVAWNSDRADLLVSNSKPPGEAARFFLPYEEPPYDDSKARSGIVQVIASSLEELKSCPESGYEVHWNDATEGSIYCVRTRDGRHFAAIHVVDVRPDRISFNWKYQPKGGRHLD